MSSRSERSRRRVLWIVGLAALAMGLPTIRGGFVGGDDYRLALNHALVNHPSLEHALKLFTIPHRDLYQPLPLLTFQLEFAVAHKFDLFREGPDAAGWLFHFNNVWLHALNAILVFFVVRMLHGHVLRRRAKEDGDDVSHDRQTTAVATVAALLFAVHPFQMEVIAWLNGRMMLLSTLFALASLMTFDRWLDRGRPRHAVLTLLFVILCGISKVRLALPILMLVVALARRTKLLTPRFAALWIVCGALTGVLVLVNIEATAGAELFSQGAEHLRGSRLARVLMALAFYFQHFVWPAGLCSYYPTPPFVSWSDAGTVRGVLIAIPVMLVMGWASYRWLIARLGLLWFFASLAVTLPFFPARNVLAADRYMYLPMIGMAWALGACACAVYGRSWATRGSLWRVGFPAGLGVVLVPVLIGVGWHVGRFYETPLSKSFRTASLFPDTPRVWEPYGWTLYGKERYDEAIECARLELRHDASHVRSGAYQLWGMCELRMGRVETALQYLHQALKEDPQNSLGMYRLGNVYVELGRLEEARAQYEAASQIADLHNPTLNRLASVYRRLGRVHDARTTYERALANGKGYDVKAVMGLVELDIDRGTREALSNARKRLLDLLAWMPENLDARTNLGVVLQALGETEAAAAGYEDVLREYPDHMTALVNLGQIYLGLGDEAKAAPLFQRAARIGPLTLAPAVAIHDFLVDRKSYGRAAEMWNVFLSRFPDTIEARAYLAWIHALSGELEQAVAGVPEMVDESRGVGEVVAARAFIELSRGRFEEAISLAGSSALTAGKARDVRQRLLVSLQQYDAMHPGTAWTFCLAAELLLADGNRQGAAASIDFCGERCGDDACRREVERLTDKLRGE